MPSVVLLVESTSSNEKLVPGLPGLTMSAADPPVAWRSATPADRTLTEPLV